MPITAASATSTDEDGVEWNLTPAPFGTEGERSGPTPTNSFELTKVRRQLIWLGRQHLLPTRDDRQIGPRRLVIEFLHALIEGCPVPTEILRQGELAHVLPEQLFKRVHPRAIESYDEHVRRLCRLQNQRQVVFHGAVNPGARRARHFVPCGHGSHLMSV